MDFDSFFSQVSRIVDAIDRLTTAVEALTTEKFTSNDNQVEPMSYDFYPVVRANRNEISSFVERLGELGLPPRVYNVVRRGMHKKSSPAFWQNGMLLSFDVWIRNVVPVPHYETDFLVLPGMGEKSLKVLRDAAGEYLEAQGWRL